MKIYALTLNLSFVKFELEDFFKTLDLSSNFKFNLLNKPTMINLVFHNQNQEINNLPNIHTGTATIVQ